jgi:hypothetical protein
MNQHDFCRVLLQQARNEAKEQSIALPKGITALSNGNGQFFMEADGVTGEYVSADCGYEARAKYIHKIIAKIGGDQSAT